MTVREEVIIPEGRLLESAYHEAGHVVIAHALNLNVLYAYVVWDEERKRWGGGMKAIPNLDRSALEAQMPVIVASKAKESLAGMFAQAMFMASQQAVGDLLAYNVQAVDFDRLLPLLKGRQAIETPPGPIRFEFWRPDGTIQSLQLQANLCLISDEDIQIFNHHVDGRLGCRPTESREELIVETIKLLNNAGLWNTVKTIAMALVNDDQGRRLERSQLARMLATCPIEEVKAVASLHDRFANRPADVYRVPE
jgi:hypothetical protein